MLITKQLTNRSTVNTKSSIYHIRIHYESPKWYLLCLSFRINHILHMEIKISHAWVITYVTPDFNMYSTSVSKIILTSYVRTQTPTIFLEIVMQPNIKCSFRLGSKNKLVPRGETTFAWWQTSCNCWINSSPMPILYCKKEQLQILPLAP